MPDTDPVLLMGLVGELDTFNLLHKLGDEGLHLKRTDYDSYQLWLTPLGTHFVIHLLGKEVAKLQDDIGRRPPQRGRSAWWRKIFGLET